MVKGGTGIINSCAEILITARLEKWDIFRYNRVHE